MFSFTRSRSRLRIKNSQSRSRLRNPAVLQCFLLYNFFIPRLQNWFLLLTRFSVRAIPFHQTGARRRLCCPRDIFLEHVIGSDFALLSINQINSVQFTFPGHCTGSDSFSYLSIKSTQYCLQFLGMSPGVISVNYPSIKSTLWSSLFAKIC